MEKSKVVLPFALLEKVVIDYIALLELTREMPGIENRVEYTKKLLLEMESKVEWQHAN